MLNQSGQSSARYFDGENMSDAVGLYEETKEPKDTLKDKCKLLNCQESIILKEIKHPS